MHISRVRIENMKGFRQLELRLCHAEGKLAGWTVLTGRNGSGKTTLLRALALGVAGPRLAGRLCDMSGWMSEGSDQMSVTLEVTPDGREDMRASQIPPIRAGVIVSPAQASTRAAMAWRIQQPANAAVATEPELVGSREHENDEALHTFWSTITGGRGWFACGYGAARRVVRSESSSEEKDPYSRVAALASLFQEDAALNGVVGRLKSIYLQSLDPQLEPEPRGRAQALLQFLCDLLNQELLPDGMRVERVDSRGLWVTQGAAQLRLEDLSDGYRVVAALVVDLVLRLSLDGHGFPYGSLAGDPLPTQLSGVVLLDEADLHLHVAWQQKLGFWLKSHFPNIQFIVTTHSPFICQAADLIIRLPPPGSEDRAAHVSAEVFRAVVNGSADDAVMSELFGLESSRSPAAEKRLTELAQLERLVRKDRATPEERARYQELDAQMPTSADVDRAVRSLEGGR